MNRIKRTIAALVAAVMLSASAAGCGHAAPALVDYPPPQTWVFFYQGQGYCGWMYDVHEVDMYGSLACTRTRFPSAAEAIVAGTLAAAALAYLTMYDGFYHSGFYYDSYLSPMGRRYHVTVVQKNTFISNSRSFESKYAGQIKTNSAKATWANGKTGNYTFPADNSKARNKGPLTNTNGGNANPGRAGGDAGTSRTNTGTTSGGKTGTKPGTTRVGGRR